MKSTEINIGNIVIGGNNKIAVQTMTNTATNNIVETIEQCKILFDNGAELVRITVPTINDIECIRSIKIALVNANYYKPIIADIHYKPEIALQVADFVEKIRVNPGNYITKSNLSEAELGQNLKDKFLPLIQECKKHNTVIRLGANYGSLSDNILQKYGNTPKGMVKSVEEFLDLCYNQNFTNIVMSMKASDPRIMVQASRMLQLFMLKNNIVFPQHLGVTEAGNGNEARIKSAIGMATLLSEGIGDTIRVSLTENPLSELPAANSIVKYFSYKNKPHIVDVKTLKYRDYTINCVNKYIVISNFSEQGNNYNKEVDFYYLNTNKLKILDEFNYIIDYKYWDKQKNVFPIYSAILYKNSAKISEKYNFILDVISNFTDEVLKIIEADNTSVIIIDLSEFDNIFDLRNSYNSFIKRVNNTPIIIHKKYSNEYDEFIIKSAGELGSILIDKLAGGLWLQNNSVNTVNIEETAFAILQATKLRISKTEYVSCPTCGRTKFDIEQITNEIKQKTSHFKGITIAIMGCVVNGPGEMADADYGYVGAGSNLVHLYKKGKVLLKNIKQENAVGQLIKLLENEQKKA